MSKFEIEIPKDVIARRTMAADLAVRLRTHLDQSQGLTIESVSHPVGMDASSLSKFLKETESHQTEGNIRKVATYLRLESERANTKLIAGFVETSISRDIYNVAARCHKLSKIGIIQGPSGIGKTQAVLNFQAVVNNGLIFWVRARPNCTPAMLLTSIAAQIHALNGPSKSRIVLEDRIMEKLTPNHMIIVDQAHEMKPACIDELMMIQDETRCSMILIGTKDTWRVIEAAGGGMYEQFADRVTVSLEIKARKTDAGLQWFTPEDVDAIARNVAEDLSPAAVAWLGELANKRGSLRLSMAVLQLALDAGLEPAEITAKHLAGFMRLTPGARVGAA